jgi:ubiquinone/menaquinone biosynthesis C-methylase UbiE
MTNTEHPLWAAVYDPFSLPFELLGIRRQHARIGEDARGRVLDLGIRTGLSLPFYTHADEVVGVDPDPHMLKRARRRAEHVAFPVRLVEAPAESLPFGDNEFDAVVIVFGLCTFPDPDAAVREARRVLKPNGRLLFLEHVQSGRPRLARMLDLLTALSRRFTGGCHLNRRSVETIARHFEIEHLWDKGILVQGAAQPNGRDRLPARPDPSPTSTSVAIHGYCRPCV